MQYYNFGKPSEVKNGYIDRQSAKSIGYYILLGSASLLVIGLVAPQIELPFLANVELSLTQSTLYSVLIAIAEEQFFRGFLANYLAKQSMLLGIFGSAAIFTVFHLAVYGADISTMFYVMSAGLLLAYVGIRSGRLSVPMVVHIINNFGAWL
jgi:membrane protease YdiL (CAAX protease family)